MADAHMLDRLRAGAAAWNAWRDERPDVVVDLSDADLRDVDLSGAHLSDALMRKVDARGARFAGASLNAAYLREARLAGADLTRAELEGANLAEAELDDACLFDAIAYRASLNGALARRADLRKVGLSGADLSFADLSDADLREAALNGAALREADLTNADLRGADLSGAQLVETQLQGANLSGCQVYGVSAWNVGLAGTRQDDLRINRDDEPVVTVDNVEVAQFVYLLLNNSKIRDVIDTVTSKAVLILGRFTPERKRVLDVIREELRRRNYAPILFDFDIPADRDITETVTLLARLSRFIVADLTEPSSIPKELEAIVPTLAVPVQALLHGPTTERAFSMFGDLWKYDWVLPVHHYADVDDLVRALDTDVIAASERKAAELGRRREAARS